MARANRAAQAARAAGDVARGTEALTGIGKVVKDIGDAIGHSGFMHWWKRKQGERLRIRDIFLLLTLGWAIRWYWKKGKDIIPDSYVDDTMMAGAGIYLASKKIFPEKSDSSAAAESKLKRKLRLREEPKIQIRFSKEE